jgi:hypothetical protein
MSHNNPCLNHIRQLTGLFRRITLSIKILVKSPHTWKGLAIRVVSGYLACADEAVSSLTVFTVDPLLPGNEYFGPSGTDNSNLCKCSTIAYSLVSACAACQGADWITYDRSFPLITVFMNLPLDGPNG